MVTKNKAKNFKDDTTNYQSLPATSSTLKLRFKFVGKNQGLGLFLSTLAKQMEDIMELPPPNLAYKRFFKPKEAYLLKIAL